jgi:acyl transferase domain-containing protein/phosphopantetheinyl transferase
MATRFRLICALPAARAHLAERVLAAGGVPMIDLTCAPDLAQVPEGAWVRVRSAKDVPGTGPVVLAAGTAHPEVIADRPTWLELTEAEPVSTAFAGVILRGSEAGGPCGARAGLEMLRAMPAGVPVILDAGTGPGDVAEARLAGARGLVLSDLLLGLPALELPPGLRARLDRADATTSHLVNGFRIQAAPLAPVLRRLLSGSSFWKESKGWMRSDNPAEVAFPAGLALGRAREVADRYADLEGLLEGMASEAAAIRSVAIPTRTVVSGKPEPVAIVGLGCRLPGAQSVDEFWQMVLDGRNAIIEVPKDRWDPTLFWDEDKSAVDKTYAKIGGFLRGFEFHPRRFRIPPRMVASIDPVQQITLEAVADALEDAGLKAGPRDKDGKDFDRTACAVILGNSMGGEYTDDYTVRARVPAFQQALAAIPDFQHLPEPTQQAILAAFGDNVVAGLPPINEDAMPGELANVIAGRVANAFDLSGPNFTVDAACASSMAAVQAAVKGLQQGDFDMAVTGGADRSMGVATYTKFCKIGALSPRHSVPFDAEADGFVMGEGAGILILKRLSDAERDGDRVYAVIKGIGGSSDGKGKGITAPNPRGQKYALSRAYEAAGIDPAEVDLIEAHGTSTVVGDKVEVDSLAAFVGPGRRGERGPMRIGSVKSNIGHLKSAAGAASLIKTALAIHHGILPPSAGFRNARPDVGFDVIPLQVQTAPEPWNSMGPRRAGVSAFGFGGTNFHVVLEQFGTPAAAPAVTAPPVEATPLPPGLWALSAEDRAEMVARTGKDPLPAFEASAPIRVVAAAPDEATREAQLTRLRKSLERGSDGAMLRSRGIALEEEPFDGKVAFLFTGQGSQYIGMGLKLAERYPIVAQTFEEADRVMLPELGRPLTAFIRPDPSLSQAEQFARLQDTAISQPATLAVDIGILRLLAGFGVLPDMVAGHSLGEYGAVVAAGIMSFEDALVAVSARGREMAAVKIDDPGRMAGIAAAEQTVIEVLAEIPGYVVAANKNCPTQTVIAGETHAVEAAMEAFRSRGITVHPLPVSHAFHTRVVAPASGPLRKVLERLDIRPPQRPITTNVTSGWYPQTRGEILDLLSEQVAAPVEWISQLERMYADGARVFVECGPKRALTGFVASTLKRRPHRAIFTNHPKVGELESFDNALAALVSLGLPVRSEPIQTSIFTAPEPRLATTKAIQQRLAERSAEPAGESRESATGYVLDEVLKLVGDITGYAPEELSADDELEADLGVDTVKQAEVVARLRDRFQLEHDPNFRLSQLKSLRDLADYAGQRLGATRPAQLPPARTVSHSPLPVSAPVARPAPKAAARPRAEVSAPLSVASPLPASALQALAEGAVRAGLAQGTAEAVAQAILPAFADLISSLQTALAASMPAPAPVAPPVPQPQVVAAAAPAHSTVSVVATGASLGLPGGDEIFSPENVQRILAGENRIERLSAQDETDLLSRNIVRLHKDPKTGQGTFVPVDTPDQLIRLAGIGRGVDPAEYGISASLARALDITSILAIGAGLEALRDAGIPLIEVTRTTGSGRTVTVGWRLPEALRDGTGVIFASAFPGYTNLMKHMQANGDDGEGRFDRRFLFQVLGMGHSQFAQFIGARGPNTCVNAACASTTQAVSIAEDWIRLGRAERVIVVGADDVTNDQMLSWIGAGFLAAGAATTADKVEDAALPFDARRNGMILGMGAVGLVVEREDVAQKRGTKPIARLLATQMANSAFHGTRLDADHISAQVRSVVEAACTAAGVTPDAMASNALFMSHETYTPARGGSAAAEIFGLRAAFGDAANQVVVTNTKGFTGHPMGAGIEDAIALKALQYETIPPVPNLKVPDPDLGDLTLSSGGPRSVRFAIRLAAGFGSQLALAVWEAGARGDNRTDASLQKAWLQAISGYTAPELTVENRTLRVVEGQPAVAPAPAEPTQQAPVAPPAPAASAEVDRTALGALVRAVLAEKTGYDASEFEDDDELEADLGVDTVKQAEVLADLREKLGIPAEQEVQADGPLTIKKLVEAIALAQSGGTGPAPEATPPAPEPPAPPAAAPTVDRAELLKKVRSVLAEKTGYAADEFEEDDELEADLGIDTVKQAEVLADLREQLGLSTEAQVAADGPLTLGSLTNAIAAALAGGSVAPSEPVSPPEAPPDATPAAPAPKPAPKADTAPRPSVPTGLDLPAMVRQVLADKTGYAADEFEGEDELEADLGIDTVKQAEVLADLREQLGISAETQVQADGPLTVNALVQAIEDALAAAPTSVPEDAPEAVQAAPEAAEPPAPAAAPAADGPSRDEILALVRTALADKTGYHPDEFEEDDALEADLGIDTVKQAEVLADLRERLGLPTDATPAGDGAPTVGGLADAMHTLVANMGAPTPTLDDPAASDAALKPEDTLVPEGVPVDDPDDKTLPPSFRVRRPIIAPSPVVGAPRDIAGDIVVVLGEGPFPDALRKELTRRGCHVDPDLAAIGDAPVAAYLDAGQSVVDTFEAAKATHGIPPKLWVCATRLGADPSWVDPEVGLQDGARAGAAKSLGREWPGTTARVIDVDPLLDDLEAARILVDEAATPDPTTEVFLDGRTRQAVRLVVDDLPPMGAPLRDNPVVVLTGGTRGVTARVALEMASRGPVRLVLVARTAPGTEPLDEAAAKAAIKAELQAAGERATPAKVEKRLKPMRKAEEARETVEQLKALGAEVLFVAADMRNEESVVAALEQARSTFGFIDGVVHGAGIEESRQLPDKTLADFQRIFESKASGGMALARSLGRVAWFVHMGSVAGRFGNAGQIDYSAANEALARVCLSRPRSLQVDWTAWGDTGMAVRGGMQHLLESRGVDLLPAAAGAALLVDLIAAGTSGELVVAGGLGNFDEAVAHPVLERLYYDGDAVVCEARLSKETAPWILDHAIDGVPVLPGVVGLEMMAAAASRAAPGLALVGADRVHFSTPFKLYGDAESVAVVRAERTGPHSVQCVLSSRREARGGRVIEAEHFRATIQLQHAPDVEPLAPAFFFAEDPVEQAAIYERFFHGPGFQVLQEVGAIALNGLIADAVVDHSALGDGLLTRPLVLETAFQAAGLHRMAVHGEMALPESVEGVRWMGESLDGDRLGVMVHTRDDGAYDIDIDGPVGAILRVRGFRMVVTGPLPDPQRFEVPEDGWPVVLRGAAVTPVKPAGDASAVHPYAPMAAVWSSATHEPIPADERRWLTARGRPSRIRDRLAGQAAARAAVRQATGWSAEEFSLVRDADGVPTVHGPEDRSVAVSLTHSDGGAMAVAGVGSGRIGIDAEPVVLRSPAFSRAWLTPLEQRRDATSARAVTLAWCAKEAVLKALGTGLRLHPRQVEVTQVVGRRLDITVTGEVAQRVALLGGGRLVCTWAEVDGLVVVGATLSRPSMASPVVQFYGSTRRAG